VTTTLGTASHTATCHDGDATPSCCNATPDDCTRRNRHGWHGGGQGSNPLSSTKFLQLRSGIRCSVMVAVQLGERSRDRRLCHVRSVFCLLRVRRPRSARGLPPPTDRPCRAYSRRRLCAARWPGVSGGLSLGEARPAHAGPLPAGHTGHDGSVLAAPSGTRSVSRPGRAFGPSAHPATLTPVHPGWPWRPLAPLPGRSMPVGKVQPCPRRSGKPEMDVIRGQAGL
jgi:hypothetical protein